MPDPPVTVTDALCPETIEKLFWLKLSWFTEEFCTVMVKFEQFVVLPTAQIFATVDPYVLAVIVIWLAFRLMLAIVG